VPLGAVFETRQGRVVYVRGSDGATESRPVEVGATDAARELLALARTQLARTE
jgi:hypothetical protein